MKINEESRIQLIRYRLEQANECIDEVSFLLENKKFKIAVNRIYYGMFYSLLALALSEKYESSKHSQLLGWFNKNFIHTGKLDVVYGKMIYKAFAMRNESDYEPFVINNEQEVEGLYVNMKSFISEVSKIAFSEEV